jgi:hypothetical protein
MEPVMISAAKVSKPGTSFIMMYVPSIQNCRNDTVTRYFDAEDSTGSFRAAFRRCRVNNRYCPQGFLNVMRSSFLFSSTRESLDNGSIIYFRPFVEWLATTVGHTNHDTIIHGYLNQ